MTHTPIVLNPFSYRGRSYFTEFTVTKGIFYLVAIIYVLATCLIVTLQPYLSIPCDLTPIESRQFENVAYDDNPCRYTRFPHLLFLTPQECDFGRRLVASVVLGGVIGWERRESDRPAGIRTMSLVSLGSCLFSLCSAYAFIDGPMAWDASRVSAAIPSGVGFLGAGLIFKSQKKDEDTGEDSHVVHGLTTAASVWLSAAVGIACGGRLYFVSSYSVAIILVLLRFGPRMDDHSHDDNAQDDGEYGSITQLSGGRLPEDPEMQPLGGLRRSEQNLSTRSLLGKKRAQLKD